MADMSRASESISGQISTEFKIMQHSILNALAKGITEDINILLEDKVDLGQPQGKTDTGVKINFFVHGTAVVNEEENEEMSEKVLNYMNDLKNPSSLISMLRSNGVK